MTSYLLGNITRKIIGRMLGGSASLSIIRGEKSGGAHYCAPAAGSLSAATEAGDSGAPGKGAGEAGLRTSPAMAMEGDSTAAAWVAEL